MDKKQYNNIINWTLKHEESTQVNDSVCTAKAIFNNMGVALPQGNCTEISNTLKDNDYMGWTSCTAEEAQESANNGTAAIAINDNELIVIAAEDEEEPITKTSSVMTLAETSSTPNDTTYYVYNNTTTYPNGGGNNGGSGGSSGESSGGSDTSTNEETLVLDKPYDPTYPYTNNFADAEVYYDYLSTYSHDLRNEVVYKFTFDEFNKFRAHLALLHYERSSTHQAKMFLEDMIDVTKELMSYLPKIGVVFGFLNTASTISSLGKDSVQENLGNIKDSVDAFSYFIGSDKKIWKRPSYITYTVSLLMQDPLNGRQIKIESSLEDPEIYTIQNAAYDSAQLAASIYAHDVKIYKVAPNYSYFNEN